MTNKQRTSESVKNSSSRFCRSIPLKHNPLVDVPVDQRRCSECGKLFPLKEFRIGKLGQGYHYKCKDCREYEKTYGGKDGE